MVAVDGRSGSGKTLLGTAVADRLGHQDSTETLRTYAHLWDDDEDRALAHRVGDEVRGAVAVPGDVGGHVLADGVADRTKAASGEMLDKHPLYPGLTLS